MEKYEETRSSDQIEKALVQLHLAAARCQHATTVSEYELRKAEFAVVLGEELPCLVDQRDKLQNQIGREEDIRKWLTWWATQL